MKILYLSASYVPSRRASSIQVMKMCQAIAKRGHEIVLVAKTTARNREEFGTNVFEFYGVDSSFSLRQLDRPPWRGGGALFAWRVQRILSSEASSFDLVYCRDPIGAWLACRLDCPVVFEAHEPPHGKGSQRLIRSLLPHPRFQRLVLVSDALRDEWRDRDLLPPKTEVVVAHDGADLPKHPSPEPALEITREAGPHIGYVGHLYPGKGVETIVQVARDRPGYRFHVVGGAVDDLATWRQQRLPLNLRLHGFVAPGKLDAYFAGFDALVLPPRRHVTGATKRHNIASWMSPLKLFEYMAAGRPIIASDLPVLGEILEDGRNALLVPPDDPRTWGLALDRVLAEPELGQRLAQAARSDLETHYTWDHRAERVLIGFDHSRNLGSTPRDRIS